MKVNLHFKPTSPLEQNRVRFVSFFAFISKSVNNQCYNPYIIRKIYSKSIQNEWVVAVVVYLEIGKQSMLQPIRYIFGKISTRSLTVFEINAKNTVASLCGVIPL